MMKMQNSAKVVVKKYKQNYIQILKVAIKEATMAKAVIFDMDGVSPNLGKQDLSLADVIVSSIEEINHREIYKYDRIEAE